MTDLEQAAAAYRDALGDYEAAMTCEEATGLAAREASEHLMKARKKVRETANNLSAIAAQRELAELEGWLR